MVEVDPLVAAYLVGVAIWSFLMAFVVGYERITRAVRSGKSRLYNALIALFENLMVKQRAAIVTDIKAAIVLPDLSLIDKLREAFNTNAATIQAALSVERLQGLFLGVMQSEEGRAAMAAAARAAQKGAGGGRPPAGGLDEAVSQIEAGMTRPDLVALAQKGHALIDLYGTAANWSAATKKEYHKQVGDALASGQFQVLEDIGRRLNLLGGDGAPSVTVRGKGGPI